MTLHFWTSWVGKGLDNETSDSAIETSALERRCACPRLEMLPRSKEGLEAFCKVPDLDAQSDGYVVEVHDTDVSDSSFDPRDVRPVKICPFSELLLRHPCCQAPLAYRLPQYLSWIGHA